MILKHEDANIKVEELASGNRLISIEPLKKGLYVRHRVWETSYPIDLIEKILEAKGPGWLCDEIMREESPGYIKEAMKYNILCYVSEEEFKNKKILDFGCGSGASTILLRRMFPASTIVGIELEEKLLSIAKLRARHYGFDEIKLIVSPEADSLPEDIGRFDYILLNAVVEHLLPDERKTLLQKIWDHLKPGGILFLNGIPHRYLPVEFHTTSGLPLINYLPDKPAYFYARYFSRRNLKNKSWEGLLRKGIRGSTVSEILNILKISPLKPILLNPCRMGAKDRTDLWYIQSRKNKFVLLII